MIFLRLENQTNSDRMPPYIDTYRLQLFPNFGNYGKKRSPIRMILRLRIEYILTYYLGKIREKTSIDYTMPKPGDEEGKTRSFESKPSIRTILNSSKLFRSVANSASKWPREHAHEPIHREIQIQSEVWLVYSRYNDISV